MPQWKSREIGDITGETQEGETREVCSLLFNVDFLYNNLLIHQVVISPAREDQLVGAGVGINMACED